VRGKTLTGLFTNKATVSTIALVMAMGVTQPAWATIDNTVTVNATDPDGDPVLDSGTGVAPVASETVDVVDEIVTLVTTKTITSSPADPAGYVPGETITYQFTVQNTGNITLTNVTLADVFDGVSGPLSLSVPTSNNLNGENPNRGTNPAMSDVETIIIAAVVIGLAVARTLVLKGQGVLVIEQQSIVGNEVISRKS